jgi:hypothetical protein
MSSRSHCAVDIIANCIDVGTKQRGGERSALSLSVWQTLCGARHIRSRDLGFALRPVLIRAKRRAAGHERFSPSLWNLGITLAKAQAELVNPEKSLAIC